MDVMSRIEQALQAAVGRAEAPGCPPRLAAAMRHAVFPRGARIRPRLCLAVAAACGEDEPGISAAAAAAIELLHSASLVHDDLPCFDDAPFRRGRPSVHVAFGEPLAVLAGDALIVLSFQQLAVGVAAAPGRLAALLGIIGGSVGVPGGIVAGQAWECEPEADLRQYQREKTGALFVAATMAGAAAAGSIPGPWRLLGEQLGEAYQVADDLRDAACNPAELGKPVGRDAALGRPSAVGELGLDGAIDRLRALAAEAVEAVPACPGASELRAHILSETQRLLPRELAATAA
ncbi:MAG: polyprenyl synthetase family protein [Acetobacteraceae bacterium]|nr:polyprenyl synthetase family protein [Acetobacteraceae bacterium]